MSIFATDSAYWTRKDTENYIRSLFKIHSSSFPKIKKELGFSALSSIDISSIPWQLYVMALSKTLIPASNPAFFEPITNCKTQDREMKEEMEKFFDYLDEDRIACNICSIIFTANEKDINGMSAIQKVGGLYKLHKSINHLYEYPLCLACFYALQNPVVSSDYPKNNRKDPVRDDHYTHTFQMLKRESDFCYLGEIENIGSDPQLGYIVPKHALCDPETLNIDDYAR